MKEHTECKTYFRTTAVDSIIKKLEEGNIAILSGKQGDGKTTLAYQVMCELSRESSKIDKRTTGKKPILISNADQWLKYINPEDDVIVYIDDFVGSTNFTKDEAARWKRAIDSMYACTRRDKVLLLLGIQKQILEEAREQFSYPKLLSDEFVVDTSSLTVDDRKNIYDLFEEQYIQTKIASERSSVIAQKQGQAYKALDKDKESIVNTESVYGFPLACRLYFDQEHFHELGVAFFNRPDANLLNEIEKLRKEKTLSYLLLVYILLCGKIDIDNLNEELLRRLYTALDFTEGLKAQGVSNWKISDALDTLKKPYLEKATDTEGEYQFSHKTVSDNVLLSFGKVAPEIVIEECSRCHLFELIRTQKTKKSNTELVIPPKCFKALAERLCKDENSGIERSIKFHGNVKGKNLLNIAFNIVWHPVSSDEKFVESLLLLDTFRENKNLLSKMWHVIPGSLSSAMSDKMLDMIASENTSSCKKEEKKENQSSHVSFIKQKSKFILLKSCIDQCIDNYAGNLHTLCCLKHIEKDAELHKLLNIPFKHSPNDMTLLHCSILQRWEDVVDKILKIHKPTLAENGWSCLHFAAYIGSSTLLKRFVEYGLDLAGVTKDGHTVLQAAFFGLRYGAFETNWPVYSIYEKDRFQMSLCFPSNDEFEKTLQFIFQCSPAIVLDNIKMEVDEYGNTIFYYLVLQDYPDIINLLSRHIEDSVLERNSTELPTLLHLAVYLGRPLITKILWNDAVRPIGNDPSLMDTLYEGQKLQNKSIVFSDLDVKTKWCWNDKKKRCDGVKIKNIANIDVIFGSEKDFDNVKSFLQSQGE